MSPLFLATPSSVREPAIPTAIRDRGRSAAVLCPQLRPLANERRKRSPKSALSARAVPMADRVGGELDRYYKASAFQGDDGLVFGHPITGAPLDRHEVSRRFKAALKRAGVREVRFHDLRHTFGTRM